MSGQQFIPPGTVFVPGHKGWVAHEGWPEVDQEDDPLHPPRYQLPGGIQCGACGHDELVVETVSVVGGRYGLIWLMRCPTCRVGRQYPAGDHDA